MMSSEYKVYRSPLEKLIDMDAELIIHKIKNKQDLQRLTAKVNANNSYEITAVQCINDKQPTDILYHDDGYNHDKLTGGKHMKDV